MTESNLQKRIRHKLSLLGHINFRLNSGMFWQGQFIDGKIINPRAVKGLPRGTADLLAIQHGTGRAIFIELKTATGKATPEQENFLKQMKEQGAIAGVVRSVDDLMKLLGGN